ncbi:hypothetical protein [Streptomyces sudanensis]|uniref:hypothetical protein n=1 Tax=Streptomyces sudanensis TaxID=436397 RepID=UPI0020CCBFE2|nr:hypothetical protein [Streptomyces sudanensis]MCQ0003027.1 hypothetical protein [Streptomyces sudanensis]
MMKRAVWQGLVAGAVGGVVMTLGEKIEQASRAGPTPTFRHAYWNASPAWPSGPAGSRCP